VNYFRAELHPPDVLDAIRTNSIGVVPTNAPIVTNVTAGSITASSATITWTTDQSSDSIVEYGLTARYGSATTNTTPIYYHTLTITGLSANTTYHDRAESRNASNSLGVSGDYVFTTLAASVSDVIVESYLPNGTLNSGVTVPTVKFATNGVGSLSGSARMYSDAIKFVYVPPPPSAPLIATQPQSQTINQGNTVTFSVVASGTAPLTCQWKHAGTNLAGATDSSFTKVNVQPSDTGTYAVGITNSVGGTNSGNATLTVNLPTTITAQPQSVTTNAGANVTFSVTATGTAPLSYRWQLEGADIPGATGSSYTRTNVQSGDAGAYSVIVSNVAAAVTSADAVLSVLVPPAITAQPQSVTTNAGSDVTFSVTATGTAPLSLQWRLNGTHIAGVTDSGVTRTNVQGADAGNYSVVVSNVAGTVTSTNATLTVTQATVLDIDAIALLPDGRAQLAITGGPGNFAIDVAPEPSGWTQWTSLTATGTAYQYTDPDTNQVSRFYRVRMLP